MKLALPLVLGAILLGFVAGHFYSLEVGTARVLESLPAADYLHFKTAMDARFQVWVGTLWTSSLVIGLWGLVMAAKLRHHALRWATAAFALNVAGFVILLTINEPANQLHARLLITDDGGARWDEAKDAWNLGQSLRTYCVAAAFCLQSIAAIRSQAGRHLVEGALAQGRVPHPGHR